jgi:nicotinate-nucleotide adenylyltransferase
VQVAVYGGSFDPPHVGHAMVAGWLLWTGRVDRVWLVPAYQHAFDKQLRPFEQRLELCRALARDVDPERIEVLDIEARLPTPSYTLHTLEALADQHPQHRFRLVVGADVLEQTEHWHAWERIQRNFAPIVVGRDGYPPVPDAPVFPGVSSTEIRRRLAQGLPVDALVTAGVAASLRQGGAP